MVFVAWCVGGLGPTDLIMLHGGGHAVASQIGWTLRCCVCMGSQCDVGGLGPQDLTQRRTHWTGWVTGLGLWDITNMDNDRGEGSCHIKLPMEVV